MIIIAIKVIDRYRKEVEMVVVVGDLHSHNRSWIQYIFVVELHLILPIT